ncbi:hypothetical protein Q5752_003625 [Cryptotrichosporon argae]
MLRFLVALFALTTLLALARPTQVETNADRFRRGLPPSAPKRMYDVSRTGPHLSRRSGGVLMTNSLEAYRPGATSSFGYLSYSPNSFSISTTSSIDLTYTTASTASQMTLSGMGTTFYAAALTPGTSEDLSVGSGHYAFLATSAGSDGGDPAAYHSTNNRETSIWNTGSGATPSLTVTYVNPTGTTVPLRFWYNPDIGNAQIALAASLADANAYAGSVQGGQEYAAGDEVLFYWAAEG